MAEKPAQTKQERVAIIGCGFMGTALLAGVLKSLEKQWKGQLSFSVSARTSSSIDRLKQAFAAHRDQVSTITDDNQEAVRGADTVILAFQPQQLTEILNDGALQAELRSKLIISLLAGVSVAQVIHALKGDSSNARVTRVVPSIGAQVGESASLVAKTPLSQRDENSVQSFFQLAGRSVFVPEHLMDTATAVSATCHALTIVAVDAIVDASVAEGVPRSTSTEIVSQCLRGAASMLQGQTTLDSFKESMSVPRGITITSLLQLERGHVRTGISDATRHAVQYANNMS